MGTWGWIIFPFILFLFGAGSWIARHIDSMVEWRREVKAHKLGMTPREPIQAPVCGCGHNFSFHDPQTGKCHATARQATKWERDEGYDPGYDEPEDEMVAVEWETVPCPCRRYVGPEPLTTLYSPDLADVVVEEPAPFRAVEDKPRET